MAPGSRGRRRTPRRLDSRYVQLRPCRPADPGRPGHGVGPLHGRVHLAHQRPRRIDVRRGLLLPAPVKQPARLRAHPLLRVAARTAGWRRHGRPSRWRPGFLGGNQPLQQLAGSVRGDRPRGAADGPGGNPHMCLRTGGNHPAGVTEGIEGCRVRRGQWCEGVWTGIICHSQGSVLVRPRFGVHPPAGAALSTPRHHTSGAHGVLWADALSYCDSGSLMVSRWTLIARARSRHTSR
jgi:hypothetical protein